MNKKKIVILIVLIFLLLSCLGVLFYYYLQLKCNASILNYESFDEFIISKTCRKRVYSVKGVIYNISENENTVTFDLNAFDIDNKESLYIDNVSLPLDKFISNKELLNKQIDPINIQIIFVKNSLFNDFELESWNMSELNISKEEIANILKQMYSNIKNGGKIKIYYDEYEGLPFAQIDINNDLFSFEIMEYGIDSLYKPLVETNLLNSSLSVDILGEYSSSDITTYLKKFSEFKTSSLDKDKSDEEKTNTLKIFPFGCALAEKLINSGNLENEAKEIVLNEYCNIDQLIKKLNSIIDSGNSYEYGMNDLIGSVNLDRVTVDDTNENLFDWNISLMSDISSAERIYNTSLLTDEKKEILQSSMATVLITNNEITLNNVCKIASVSEKNSDIYERVKSLFIEDVSKGLKLSDSDIYSTVWCLEAFQEDENFNDFYISTLLKLYYTNIQEKKSIYGLWNKNSYTLEGNSKFFNILLNQYEI